MGGEILTMNAEVASALATNAPVVALESTIITHGMPCPENVETARQVESAVRAAGAVPATIAIVGGEPRVGLATEELDGLGRAARTASEVSRRDLPFIMARGGDGGRDDVAREAGWYPCVCHRRHRRRASRRGNNVRHLSRPAGTGIHRGLRGLQRRESMLAVGLTLEHLETHGVPVVGFGTDTMPAFYCRESDYGVDYRLDSAAEVATAIAARKRLGLRGGTVIANPVPASAAMSRELIDAAIAEALDECAKRSMNAPSARSPARRLLPSCSPGSWN